MDLSTRNRFACAIVFCCLAFFAAISASNASSSNAGADDALPAEALRNSQSRYLREAASGPVRWQPWGAAAFALASKLKRPMLIDVGAVWCHWCHVMDDNTYSNPQVAAILNARFVPVKVDADERPDIDSYFQNAASHLTGAGGWPLTCLITPSGSLIYAAGFLPPMPPPGGGAASAMVPLLERIADAYAKDPAAVDREAFALARKIASQSSPAPGSGVNSADLRREIIASLAKSYDPEAGGFGRGSGPRFYDFPAIRLALAYGFFQHDAFREMALISLDKIARGGVFDQLGGGFHRYSTDQAWRVPHFEKMAYDQAMALIVYSEAYQFSRDSNLLEIIAGIRSYVNQTLLDPVTHAFFADQDADAFKGDDGSYYTWTEAEVNKTLPANVAHAAVIFYGMSDSPAVAPDGRIVLRRPLTDDQLARRLNMWPAAAKRLQTRAKLPMLAAREKRPAPPVDHAIMTDRNALMVSGYLAASNATGDRISRQAALAALDFVLTRLRDPHGGFYHVWSDGHASVSGVVADQVYLMEALLDAYQASGDTRYLREARTLGILIADRYRNRRGLLVNRSPDIGRVQPAETGDAVAMYDQPMPSVQAVAARAMRTLGEITSEQSFLKIADALLAPAPGMVGAVADSTLGTLGLALEERADGGATVTIVGRAGDPMTQSMVETALGAFRPGKVVVRVDPSQKRTAIPSTIRAMYEAAGHNAPLAFVCAGTACSKPASTTQQLRESLEEFRVAEISHTLALPEAPATTSR